MAQARRKTAPKRTQSNNRPMQGLGMLITGMAIGSMATILWQGMRSDDDGVGSGIRQMIEQSRQREQQGQAAQGGTEDNQPVKQQTNFDFFTVLPEIEVVVPSDGPEEAPKPQEQSEQSDQKEEQQVVVEDRSSYMLQAGSYQRQSDAERLKAELALLGMSSQIQKVTIQDRGDFYRVRLGPYDTHDKMVNADQKLFAQGYKTLRLKISKGG